MSGRDDVISESAAELVGDSSFRPAGTIEPEVPVGPGIYAIRLKIGSILPEPFESLLAPRATRLIYIGKATSLKSRMLANELRGRGHGTFFRSMGAVLGYRPLAGSLASRVNKYNFSFVKPDRAAIVDWINANLEISWLELPIEEVRLVEADLITVHTPLLNLDGNHAALMELDELRVLCRRIAAEEHTAL